MKQGSDFCCGECVFGWGVVEDCYGDGLVLFITGVEGEENILIKNNFSVLDGVIRSVVQGLRLVGDGVFEGDGVALAAFTTGHGVRLGVAEGCQGYLRAGGTKVGDDVAGDVGCALFDYFYGGDV